MMRNICVGYFHKFLIYGVIYQEIFVPVFQSV